MQIKNGMKLVLFLILMMMVKGQNQVDTVEQLLAELKGSAQVELTNLNTDFSVSKNLKDNIIFNLGKALQEQNYLCSARDQSVNDRVNDIEKTNKYIAYLKKRLDDNKRRIETLEDNRCSHNSNYIERVKNDNLTLRLIIFLRTSLQKLDEGQLANYGSYVQKFLQIYKTAKISELIELATQFKDTMQIDWQEQQLPQGKDFNSYKGELIEMLNDMERFIRNQLKNTQDLEIATGVTLGDFKGGIDMENEQMNYEISIEEKNLIKLGEKLIQSQLAAQQCKLRVQELGQSVQLAKEDQKQQEILYNQNKKRLQEEVGLFEDVYRIYSTQVGTSDDKFKQRVDQYVKQEDMSTYERKDYGLSDAIREQVSQE